MATLTVRKTGGQYSQIMAAIYAASNGDIIDIGAGTFNENIEFLGKNVTLQGAGKDQTIIQGKLANESISGCSFFAGDDTITTTSTSGVVVGKPVSGTGLAAGSRVSQVVSGTQFKVSPATTSSVIAKTATYSSGSSTITLSNTTSVSVGMRVEGPGVYATITAINTTTKVCTLNTPTTQAGLNASVNVRTFRSAITVTQTTNVSSLLPATITFSGSSNGIVLKDLCAIGFDGNPSNETAALGFSSPSSPGHQNFLIDNCKFTANGDSAVLGQANSYISGGTIQNCIFNGKTFTGSEPADIPAFSNFTVNATIKSIGTSSVITVSSTKGIMAGVTMQSSAWSASATVSAVNGNDVTINKTVSGTVGNSISCNVSNAAFVVPNVARNLIYLGSTASPCNAQNLTFKNNVIDAQTGAVIAASGNKNMFNSVVTFEVVNGVCEGNTVLSTSMVGAGEGFSNYLFRNRQSGAILRYNVDYTKGQSLLGVYAPNAAEVKPNIAPSGTLVTESQALDSAPEVQMSAGDVNVFTSVLTHPTLKDQSMWGMVAFIYKHDSSAKRLVGAFRDFTAGKKAKMSKRTGIESGQKYELIKIIVSDAARNLVVIKRDEIQNASSYDFTLQHDWNV